MAMLPSKTSILRATLALTLGVCVAGAASAQTLMEPTAAAPAKAPAAQKAAPKPAPKLVYLSPEFLAHPGMILPLPPKPESAEGQRDIAAVKAVQAIATPERIAQAASDDKNETVWFFGDVLPGFDAAKLPVTKKLFDGAQNDEEREADAFKEFFARTRPYDVDHSIKVCVPSSYGARPRSYPSGHATLAYSLGVVLTHLIPEKADVILARAKVYAENRVVCGVHFPSDLAASETLGTATALELMRNPEFKKAFAAAKAELVAAGLTKDSGAAH